MWRNLLTKATTTTIIDTVDQWGPLKKYKVNYSLVDKLMDFLKIADNPKLLHSILHLKICLRHNFQELCSIDVSLPLLQKPKSTTFSGLALLAFTEGEGQGPRILTVRIRGAGPHTVSTKGLDPDLGQGRGHRIRPVLEGPASLLGMPVQGYSLLTSPTKHSSTGPMGLRK